MAQKTPPAKAPSPAEQQAAIEKALVHGGKGRPKAAFGAAIEAMGHAPKKPSKDGLLERFSSELGNALARDGRLGELSSLAARGWTRLMFPDNRHGEPFDAIACRGEPGLALLEELSGSGARFFAGHDLKSKGPSPLTMAVDRHDARATQYFLAKMDHEKISPQRRRFEYGRLAAHALPNRKLAALVAPLILAEPKAWALGVDDRGGGALAGALEHGRLDLAEAMLAAEPKAAALEDITRRAFDAFPLKSLELLRRFGADPKALGRGGCTALHMAIHARKEKDAAALSLRLIELGVDPRARDKGGSTAIGAAIAMWSWPQIQKVFKATPSDLLDSVSQSSAHGVGSIPTLIDALGQVGLGRRGEAGLDAADKLMAQTLEAARADPRSMEHSFIEAGLLRSADRGLPHCLSQFAEMAGLAGVDWSAKHLKDAVGSALMGSRVEQGRQACVRLAAGRGVDLDERFDLRFTHGCPKQTTLLEMTLDALVEDAADAGSRSFKHIAAMGRLLTELGCDPSKAADAEGEWSFGPAGAGRANLPREARLEFEALDALAEAVELRGSLKEPPSPRGKRPLRV